MKNFSYDDFSVLVRDFRQDMLDSESLRIVPLNESVSMAQAIKGNKEELDLSMGNAFLPIEKNGDRVNSNVTVQHKSDGYCRLVGHLEAGYEAEVTTARTFVLYCIGEGGEEEVIAIASLKEGFEIGAGCYPSFTITTVNNYQSVAFNPNAFATVKDLKNINGLDGLHIAFDKATGDIKLLDKDGKVIDQANLPIKADVIIADGEEGYKYVKTDVQQDIHATKAWMPEGETAWDAVDAVEYTMQHAALVVESARMFVTEKEYPVDMNNWVRVDGDTYYVSPDARPGDTVTVKTEDLSKTLSGKIGEGEEEGSRVFYVSSKYEIESNEDGNDAVVIDDVVYDLTYLDEIQYWEAQPRDGQGGVLLGQVESSSNGNVVGITVNNQTMYAIIQDNMVTSSSGAEVPWLAEVPLPETGYSLRYGLDAFVWTVKDPDAGIHDTFFAALNDSLRALGFHDGDDIALGTNLQYLLADSMGGEDGRFVDPEEYMHHEDNMAVRASEVAEQRNLAKEELIAWNAQHPKLSHSEITGTRISSDGVDIRDGKLSIGDGWGIGNDAVKHYELATNFYDGVELDDTGLTLSVVDASDGKTRNVLTISDSSYISGAPICMAMLEIYDVDGLQGETKRRTACFDCEMSEDADMGTINITITDNRLHTKGFGDDCIVEISPVYISGETPEGTAPEMLPALNQVNTVATVSGDSREQLNCTCPQIIDWANSVNLNESGARLFAIVKVY